MRITGGTARGRVISGPAGLEARPTGSKVRQAFFNILSNRVPGARFLDLFAGTGLMGLEALSRGAGSLTFVEESRRLTRAIEDNVKRLGFQAEVICGDVRKVLPVLEGEAFDIIYCDPPYQSRFSAGVLHGVIRHNLLAGGGLFVLEHLRGADLPETVGSLVRSGQREYGQTALSFYHLSEDASGH